MEKIINNKDNKNVYNIIAFTYDCWENGPENDEGEMDPFEEMWYITLIGVSKNKKLPPISIDIDLDIDVSGGDRTYPSEVDSIEVEPLEKPLSEILKDKEYVSFKKNEIFPLNVEGIEDQIITIKNSALRLSTDPDDVSVWVVPRWFINH